MIMEGQASSNSLAGRVGELVLIVDDPALDPDIKRVAAVLLAHLKEELEGHDAQTGYP